MSYNPVQRINLYDLYTILIPGVAVVIFLSPFLPDDTSIGSLPLLIPLIVTGFVVGRIFQILSAILDREFGRPSHREIFSDELENTPNTSDELIDALFSSLNTRFSSLNFPDNASRLSDEQATEVYMLISDSINFSGRGKSRTFQALSDFYRSMWFVSIVIGWIYYIYGIMYWNGMLVGMANYTSIIGSLGYPPPLISLVGTFIGFGGFALFSEAHSFNKELYIRYLIVDFVAQNA